MRIYTEKNTFAGKTYISYPFLIDSVIDGVDAEYDILAFEKAG